MSSNEIWWTPATLTNNVTVANGVTLTLLSTGSINLNGKSIVCEGTGKIVKSGTISNYSSYIMSGSDYKAFYPSTLNGDVQLADKTLIVAANMTLNGHYVSTTTGSITINQGVYVSPNIQIKQSGTIKGLRPTVQSAINAASSGQNVHLSNTTYTENLTMKSGVDVIGAGASSTTLSGTVGFNNLQDTKLEDLRVTGIITIQNISNSGVGINGIFAQDRINLLNNTNWISLDGIYALSSCYIDMYNSDVDIYDYWNDLALSSGIYAHDYSYTYAGPADIYGKRSAAIRASFNTYAELFDVIFCTNTESQYWYDIDSAFDSEVWAEEVTIWSECPPKVHEYSGGEVYVYDCDECGYLRKPVASAEDDDYNDSPVLRKTNNLDPGMAEFKEAKNILRTIAREFVKSNGEKSADPKDYRNEYDTAMAIFKHIVSEYPGEKSAVFALAALADCYINLTELKAGSAYLDEITKDAKLRPHALKLQIFNLLKDGMFVEAINLADGIVKEFSDDNTNCELLITRGIIYKYYLLDLNKAKEMFQMVLSQYPDHILAEKAKVELEDMDEGKQELANTPLLDTKLSIANSPNPFNPSTNIHFTLPSEGRVVVKIFDILGREIATLIDAEKPAGSYAIVWSGKDSFGNDVASGVYFYQIRFGNQVLHKKMLLMR